MIDTKIEDLEKDLVNIHTKEIKNEQKTETMDEN